MTVITERKTNVIPTYIEHESGVTVRCDRMADHELARLIRNSDQWVLCAPTLRCESALLKRITQRLRGIRAGGSHVQLVSSEIDGEVELGFLVFERIDLSVFHDCCVFGGQTERVTEDGARLRVAVIALAPQDTEACHIQLCLE